MLLTWLLVDICTVFMSEFWIPQFIPVQAVDSQKHPETPGQVQGQDRQREQTICPQNH